MEMMTKTIQASDYKNYFLNGFTFAQYMTAVEADAEQKSTNELMAKIPLNLQRMKRITKTIVLLDETKQKIDALQHNLNWLVITENWCGDSAQITPVFNAIAEYSKGKINLRLVYRDKNPDLIDAHLTNNGRAIPKLIQLNEKFEITGAWGPRPTEAADLVKRIKSNPDTAAEYAEHLHKWYANDKQVAIQKELIHLLQ